MKTLIFQNINKNIVMTSALKVFKDIIWQDHLTLFKPGGQIMPNTLLSVPTARIQKAI